MADSSSNWGDSEKWLNSGCILKSEKKKKKDWGEHSGQAGGKERIRGEQWHKG